MMLGLLPSLWADAEAPVAPGTAWEGMPVVLHSGTADAARGERLKHHTCLPENQPRLVQSPAVLLAPAHPFNFAVFHGSVAGVLPVQERAGGAALPATKKPRIRLAPRTAQLPEASRWPGSACAATRPASAASTPPGPANPARAGRDRCRRRQARGSLPPRLCGRGESSPREPVRASVGAAATSRASPSDACSAAGGSKVRPRAAAGRRRGCLRGAPGQGSRREGAGRRRHPSLWNRPGQAACAAPLRVVGLVRQAGEPMAGGGPGGPAQGGRGGRSALWRLREAWSCGPSASGRLLFLPTPLSGSFPLCCRAAPRPGPAASVRCRAAEGRGGGTVRRWLSARRLMPRPRPAASPGTCMDGHGEICAFPRCRG